MEADWEFDVGIDSPLIDGVWPGLVDLRADPQQVELIAECHQLTGFADALTRLNAPSAPVWTSKCDVWRPDSFDPDELDALPELAGTAVACYIDLLPKSDQQWCAPSRVEHECRALCGRLHAIPNPCCRADFVIRRARVLVNEFAFGITAYLVASGPSENEAKARLASAISTVVDSVLATTWLEAWAQSYNENRGE